ncbi:MULTISPECIES: hypothetical protein [Methylobacter]|uniref:hypothetical protein n=1 Tax=Methylobacter TaxID=429 RepID=UPI0003828BBF|nr:MULTISPECIES: hypothetical protein [Methylobacter]
MLKDGLKDSIVFRTSRNIESFWDFSKDLIVDPEIEVDEIKKRSKNDIRNCDGRMKETEPISGSCHVKN